MIITQPFVALMHFLKTRIELSFSNDLRMIGQVKDQEIVAVVGFNNFMGKTCMIHCAGEGKRWLNREFLWASMDYPFNQCELDVVMATVRESNNPSAKFLDSMGFNLIHTIKDGFAKGESLNLFEIRRSAAERWLSLGKRYEQEHTQSASVS